MSLFRKMVDMLKDLVGDNDKKKDEMKKEDKHEGTQNPCGHNQQGPYGQQAQYGQQPQYSQHQGYGAPLTQHGSSAGDPPLPPSWIAQWDQNSQRYYYLDQASGHTQWELPQPSYSSSPPPGFPPKAAHGRESHGQHGAPGGVYSHETKHVVEDTHGGGHKETVEKKEKKSGKGGMLAAGAGGLAVGAVGGAMVGHAMGEDSSDEEHHDSYQQQPSYGQQPVYYQEPAPPPLEPPPPDDHSSVSSSDKEDLAEAREDYENASHASDRQEAREEYEEAYEEAYD
ncbi:MAG: hypothetical protein Q9209_005158 [Squamulea sp. 1 TL-2023]